MKAAIARITSQYLNTMSANCNTQPQDHDAHPRTMHVRGEDFLIHDVIQYNITFGNDAIFWQVMGTLLDLKKSDMPLALSILQCMAILSTRDRSSN